MVLIPPVVDFPVRTLAHIYKVRVKMGAFRSRIIRPWLLSILNSIQLNGES